MASLELQIMGALIEERDLDPIRKRGLEASDFKNNTAQEIYKFILERYEKSGRVPSVTYVTSKFKEDYVHVPAQDPLDSLVELFVEQKLSGELSSGITGVVEKVDSDPKAAIYHLDDLLNSVKRYRRNPGDLELTEYLSSFERKYERMEEAKGMYGFPYPWDALNKLTKGIHPQQLVILYGSTKACKTWVLCYIAAYLYLSGKRVIIFTTEMAPNSIALRIAAIIGEVDYTPFQDGDIKGEDKQKLLDVITNAPNNGGNLLITCGEGEALSTVGVNSKMLEYQPDIAFIDGYYRMGDARTKVRSTDHKNITNITQDLKEISLRTKTPIIATTQANRTGDKLSRTQSMGYSISSLQEADLSMMVVRSFEREQLAIRIDGQREGREGGLIIDCKPASSFKQALNYIDCMSDFIKSEDKGTTTQAEKEIKPTLIDTDDEEELEELPEEVV